MSGRDEILERVKRHFEIDADSYTGDIGLFADLIIQIRNEALAAYKAEIAAVLDGVVNQLPVNPDEKAFATQAYTNGAIDAIAAIRERLSGGKE